MTLAQLCLEQAKEKPGQELEVIKNSKSRATTFAKQLRDVGLQAGTRVWNTDNGKRYRVWYKLETEPAKSAVVDLMANLEKSVKDAKMQRKRPPDLVTANTLQEAEDYCRERGWSTSLACNKHDELEVKRRLAMVIGMANVVRL